MRRLRSRSCDEDNTKLHCKGSERKVGWFSSSGDVEFLSALGLKTEVIASLGRVRSRHFWCVVGR